MRIKINVEMNADCTSGGRAATCSGSVERAVSAYVSAVKPSGKVTWAAFYRAPVASWRLSTMAG